MSEATRLTVDGSGITDVLGRRRISRWRSERRHHGWVGEGHVGVANISETDKAEVERLSETQHIQRVKCADKLHGADLALEDAETAELWKVSEEM